ARRGAGDRGPGELLPEAGGGLEALGERLEEPSHRGPDARADPPPAGQPELGSSPRWKMGGIRIVQSNDDNLPCFPLMAALRPHLREDEFAARVQRQQRNHGYRLAILEEEGAVRAVAGYRIGESLAWGRFLYVDDLVTDAAVRFSGYGQQLFDWIVAEARKGGGH